MQKRSAAWELRGSSSCKGWGSQSKMIRGILDDSNAGFEWILGEFGVNLDRKWNGLLKKSIS